MMPLAAVPRFRLLLAALAASTVAIPLVSGTHVGSAEACSGAGGAPPVCTGPGWHAFSVHPSAKQVPTDAGVILFATSDPSACSDAPANSSLVAVALDASGNEHAGTLTPFSPSPGYDYGLHPFLWKPDVPLAPGASYTLVLSVSGATGGMGGAGGATGQMFLFTMAAGPLTPGLAPFTQDSQVEPRQVSACCPPNVMYNAGCGYYCEVVANVSEWLLSATLNPAAVDFPYLVFQPRYSLPDGSDALVDISIGGWQYDKNQAMGFNTQPQLGRPCLEVVQSRLGSTEQTSTGILCPPNTPLAPPVLSCDTKAKLIAECKGNTTDLAPYVTYCGEAAGASGTSAAGGANQGGASGATAGTNGTSGTAGGGGAAAASGGPSSNAGQGGSHAAPVVPSPAGTSGCRTGIPHGAGENPTLLVLWASLGIALRRRRRD